MEKTTGAISNRLKLCSIWHMHHVQFKSNNRSFDVHQENCFGIKSFQPKKPQFDAHIHTRLHRANENCNRYYIWLQAHCSMGSSAKHGKKWLRVHCHRYNLVKNSIKTDVLSVHKISDKINTPSDVRVSNFKTNPWFINECIYHAPMNIVTGDKIAHSHACTQAHITSCMFWNASIW